MAMKQMIDRSGVVERIAADVATRMLRRLEVIGEAAGKLSDRAKAAMPEIPWKQVAGMRNRLIHEFFNVDLSIV